MSALGQESAKVITPSNSSQNLTLNQQQLQRSTRRFGHVNSVSNMFGHQDQQSNAPATKPSYFYEASSLKHQPEVRSSRSQDPNGQVNDPQYKFNLDLDQSSGESQSSESLHFENFEDDLNQNKGALNDMMGPVEHDIGAFEKVEGAKP